MKCLDQKQIADYLEGNTSENVELHFAGCRDCRTSLLQASADTTKRFSVSAKLAEQTLQKIRSEDGPANQSIDTVMQVRQFPRRHLFARAAGLLIVATGLAYFLGTRTPHAPEIAATPSPKVVPTENKSVDNGSIAQTMKIWLDTIKVKDIKDVRKNITIRQGNGTVLRLNKKTGIFAEPLTVLHISDRTDTTVLVELKRGNALFSVEKNRYRLFCVTTPHVRIRVTGTVFSVFVDSAETKVNVLEGAVQLVPIIKSNIEQSVEQGDEAIAQGDSIVAMEIMSRLTAKKRGLMLLDYLQSNVFGEGNEKAADTSGVTRPGP